MKITYTCEPCTVCGVSSVLELEEEKLIQWHYGAHIQDVFPELSPDERELIMTGTHFACWDLLFEGMK